MRRVACAAVLALSAPALPHRLDEYLQLTALSVGPRGVHATLYLTPGVAVAKRVIALMDANGDGVLSAREQKAYATRVAGDLSLSVDGKARAFQLAAFRFPAVGAMRKGEGEIRLDFDAPVLTESGRHALAFENRHQRPIAAYLVECLVPDDPGLRVVAQSRSREQERYRLEYVRAPATPVSGTRATTSASTSLTSGASSPARTASCAARPTAA